LDSTKGGTLAEAPKASRMEASKAPSRDAIEVEWVANGKGASPSLAD